MPATALAAAIGLSNDYVGVSAAADAAGDNVNGNTWTNTGTQLVLARNTSGGALTVQPKDSAGNNVGAALSIPAGQTAVLGPFRVDLYGSAPQLVPSAATMNFRLVEIGDPARRHNTLTR